MTWSYETSHWNLFFTTWSYEISHTNLRLHYGVTKRHVGICFYVVELRNVTGIRFYDMELQNMTQEFAFMMWSYETSRRNLLL
jgi:hypothetical protein